MRSFLAIPLPDELKRAAAATKVVLVPVGSGWRFVREDGIHVTMRFLGDVDPSRRDALDGAWREAVCGTGHIALRLRGAGVFPPKGRPRVLWLGIVDETPEGSLALLAERIERAARAAGFAPETRSFFGHVTLARAPGEARVPRPSTERIGDLGGFTADHVVLFHSELGPGGARYRQAASFPLIVPGLP